MRRSWWHSHQKRRTNGASRSTAASDPETPGEYLVAGSPDDVAGGLLAFRQLGIEEVRCMVWPDRPAEARPRIIESLADVVDIVHAAGD